MCFRNKIKFVLYMITVLIKNDDVLNKSYLFVIIQ